MNASALPPEFLDRLQELLSPERFDQVLAALCGERLTGLRINALLGDGSALSELTVAGLHLRALSWPPGAYVISATERRALTESAPVREGRIYIQNPASMVPPLLLAPSAADRVLDLAAAPGSKTLQLAALMGNQGWISAVEPVRERFFRLRANLERHGAQNVHTYMKDGTGVWHAVPEQFDKVLLDAPCSSEGQFQCADPQTTRYWSARKIKEMARKQDKLLYSAVQCLKPGGTLVYSTCTFAPEENEAVIDAALQRFGDALELEPVAAPAANAMAGITAWRNRNYDPRLRGALRLLPDGIMEGFFVCVLRKRRSTLA